MSILSTCYNTLGFGRWEELCHEFIASVLPMDDPRMSVDDLSSPTWRIIFLKDDCFLQPSCEVTSSTFDPDSSLANTIISATTSHHHHYEEEINNQNLPSSPSSMIEPLFDEIDLNHHQHHHQQHQQTQHTNDTDHPTCTDSIGRSDELNQLPSPTLSRSSSLSLSDVDDQVPQPPVSPKTIQRQRKRKRQNQSVHQKKQQKQHQTQKRYKQHHDTTASMTTGTTTLFDQLTFAGINWCRYCGTTEGVNWRPGPWGKRTLCNKHGCDYKGYGLASRLPRLDLSDYGNELVEDRHRPVIQEFCAICQERGGKAGRQHSLKQHQHRHSQQQQQRSIHRTINNVEKDDSGDDNDADDDSDSENLVACDGGCSRAFHRHCFEIDKKDDNDSDAWMDQQEDTSLWFCGPSCSENRRKKRVVVDLPRKQPLMCPLKKE